MSQDGSSSIIWATKTTDLVSSSRTASTASSILFFFASRRMARISGRRRSGNCGSDSDIPNKQGNVQATGKGAPQTTSTASQTIHKRLTFQVHHIPASKAFGQLRTEGAINLYRGILSPLMMKFLQQSVMFGSYSQFSRLLHERSGLPWRTSKIFGAAIAGAFESVFMPLERVQVLMQAG